MYPEIESLPNVKNDVFLFQWQKKSFIAMSYNPRSLLAVTEDCEFKASYVVSLFILNPKSKDEAQKQSTL